VKTQPKRSSKPSGHASDDDEIPELKTKKMNLAEE